jgi:predicted ATPase
MKRIVITGAPGSGKTVITRALAELHRDRYAVVPEAATQVYTLLNTRWDKLDLEGRRAAQRQMYRLQIDQESRISAANPARTLLLDRGTIDGAAYWPEGPEDFWRDVSTTHERELGRYDAIILLDTAASLGLYDGDQSNFCRFEDAEAAIAAGNLLRQLYGGHPQMSEVPAFAKMDDKLTAVEGILDRLLAPSR